MVLIRLILSFFVITLSVVSLFADNPYNEYLPNTSDEDLAAAFASDEYEWYTIQDRPPVFQHDFTRGRSRFISIYQDIGPGGPRFSNGNGEWPWAHPSTPTNDGQVKNIIGIKIAGVRKHTTSVSEFEIVRAMQGGRWVPVRVEPAGRMIADTWTFSPGTDIIELNTNHVVDGDYTFKVHRMTLTEDNEWLFRVYRPFTTRAEYEEATNTEAVFVGERTMTDDHSIKAFRETRDVYEVPRIDPLKARQLLLETDFKLCTGDEFIPTTKHHGQVYPKDYLGVFIGNAVEQENCQNCHRDVLENVRKFDTGEWYGLIRGGGKDRNGIGVFSWYPK